jgi:hypothetical protein
MGRIALASSWPDKRALIGSSTGLGEREMSNCGTVNLIPFGWASGASKVPSSSSESRFLGSFWRIPSSFPTLSILLKYCDKHVRRHGPLGATACVTYLDSLDLEFQCSVFVDDNQGVGVHLQTGKGPHVIDTPFDASLEGRGLVCAGDDDDDFTRLQLVRYGVG